MTDDKSKVLTILKGAKKVLEENTWIKGTLARDTKGLSTFPSDSRACQFCALGAIERTMETINEGVSFDYAHYNAVNFQLFQVTGRSVPSYNDDINTTKTDILAAFDKAIARIS